MKEGIGDPWLWLCILGLLCLLFLSALAAELKYRRVNGRWRWRESGIKYKYPRINPIQLFTPSRILRDQEHRRQIRLIRLVFFGVLLTVGGLLVVSFLTGDDELAGELFGFSLFFLSMSALFLWGQSRKE